MNKIVNLISVLIILILVGYIGYDKFYVKENNDEKATQNDLVNSNNIQESQNENIFSKLVGTYEYNMNNWAKYNNNEEVFCADYIDDSDYLELVFNSDGTATGKSGMYCGEGYSFSGPYYISQNDVIVDNTKNCSNEDDNCIEFEKFSYEIINDALVIKSGSVTLSKKN